MKKRTNNPKKFLTNSVLLVLLGLLLTIGANLLFDSRFSANWSFMSEWHEIIKGVAMLFLVFIDFASSIIGIALIILGGIGIYYNAKKMR